MMNEKVPPAVVEGRVNAVTDNQDGTVTVTFVVEKLSISRSLRGVDSSEELFTNFGLRPAGNMPIRVRLPSREVAEQLDGLGRIGREVISVISDMQNLILLCESEELRGQMPPDDVAANWDTVQRGF